MSTNADRFWLAVQRRVAQLQPDVQRALLKAFRIIRESLTDADLRELVDAGGVDRLFATDTPLSDASIERALLGYRQEVRSVVETAFDTSVRTALPNAAKIDGTLAVVFDHTSPNVITAIRTMETRMFATLPAEIRDTVRAYVENGLRDGNNAKAIARTLRDIIGMSPTQAENSVKYAAKLAAQGKTAAQIEKAVASYNKRAVALNAQTNAKTAVLNAYKQGQRLSWELAAEAGLVDRSRLTKTWKGIMDDRERPEHVAMEKQTVPFDALYSNGEIIPGDSTWNCRCVDVVRVDTSEL